MLLGDDVISILPRMDAALLVAGVGSTSVSDIKECQKHLQRTPVVRVVVNKATETAGSYYGITISYRRPIPAARKPAISDAGTKYLAISRVSGFPGIWASPRLRNLPAHNSQQAPAFASNTPDPEFPVRATSAIDGAEFAGIQSEVVQARLCGNVPFLRGQRKRLARRAGWRLHSVVRRNLRRNGRRFSSTDRSVRSVPSQTAFFNDMSMDIPARQSQLLASSSRLVPPRALR